MKSALIDDGGPTHTDISKEDREQVLVVHQQWELK